MLVFATSDKGGTGRSVTSSNVLYRRALHGSDVCYLDFDFGSPTAGAVFHIGKMMNGTTSGNGLHAYLQGRSSDSYPDRIDIWSESDRDALRGQPVGSGQLVLIPGDRGGGEFALRPEMVGLCAKLLLRLDEEFDLCLVDLSAGRSHATEIVLRATAMPALRQIRSRWLVFHRWTRQHILAASDLVTGDRGILEVGVECGHDARTLKGSIRFVRTAVVDPNAADQAGLRPAQVAWLRQCDVDLRRLASQSGVGRTATLGSVPLDPVLQWREQLISDDDMVLRQIANIATVEAFNELGTRLIEESWEGL